MNAKASYVPRQGFWYLVPSLSVFTVFWIIPLFLVIGYSFFHFIYGTHPHFVGFSQYQQLLTTALFWQSLKVTFLFALGVVVFGSAISLLFAVLLYQGIRAVGLFRALFFLPYVMPVVATSTVWLWMYQPSVGIIDRILGLIGLPNNIGWVNEPTLALISVIIYTIWFSFGFTMLLFLAGLTNIPRELLEAAQVDGASGWHQFWHIIWPLLSPTTLFVIVINTINAFQTFTQIYALTRGGPLNGTTTLTYLIYEMAFNYFHFGEASAQAVIFFALILGLTGLQFWVSRRSIYYGG
ncbi:carbohydrate ABC transporter permease [Sulfobacillus thermosulfidooxidans]|uniref:carbohydrate ABC transporter permease n=1 Tax=Sulfobacillus thermosulfidooxidans TaxID=28034 RepID=UPI00036E6331|nr:sugar ABC transporter permease [Sulfobacillus thermosulfidooxidans]